MIFNKNLSRKKVISLIAIAILSSIIKFPITAAYSQDSHHNDSGKEKISFEPPPVEDNGAPAGNREGAGSHGVCKISAPQKQTIPLIAVIPETTNKTGKKNKVYAWGETTSANPTFWFYVAYPVNSQMEFILQDESENELYRSTVNLDKTQGIISLSLPQDKVNLELGKSYHWYLYVMCNPESSPDDFVEGWVKRVELNQEIQNELKLARPIERITIYAKNGLWFDTLTTIKNLQHTKPNNKILSDIWTDLLQQVGLEKISQKPVIKHYILVK